jgi:hypothetical protein
MKMNGSPKNVDSNLTSHSTKIYRSVSLFSPITNLIKKSSLAVWGNFLTLSRLVIVLFIY